MNKKLIFLNNFNFCKEFDDIYRNFLKKIIFFVWVVYIFIYNKGKFVLGFCRLIN